MKKLIKLIALVGCMAAANVHAEVAAASWTGDKKVTSVQVVNTGGIVIYFDSVVNAACTDAGTNSIYVLAEQQWVTEEGLNGIRSAAFMALTTGLKVNVLYDKAPPVVTENTFW